MNQLVRRTLNIATRFTRVGVDVLCSAVALLVDAADSTRTEDALDSAIRGGVLNYRTGNLDDGTDPYGWYERD